jgi:hypothetical protein
MYMATERFPYPVDMFDIAEAHHQEAGRDIIMSDLHTRYTSHMQVKCVYYIAQHLLTHGRMHFKILTRKIFQIRTVQLIIALYSIVEKTRSGRHPRSSEKSFSTSTDGFRRHGASREAALDSKMLLKAVLIVCVVRKERKANCCARTREFYFLLGRRSGRISGRADPML